MVRRILRYAVIARVLGVLLLAAAALKVQGLGFDPVRRLGIFAAPEFQVAVVEFEVFLGLWLLSGIPSTWFLVSGFVRFRCFRRSQFLSGLGRPIVVRLFWPVVAQSLVHFRP